MSMHDYFDKDGPTGLLVVGVDDMNFRDEADAIGRPDQRLMTVRSPDELLDPEALKIAAQGYHVAHNLGGVAVGDLRRAG